MTVRQSAELSVTNWMRNDFIEDSYIMEISHRDWTDR